jgi:hypothetical protein
MDLIFLMCMLIFCVIRGKARRHSGTERAGDIRTPSKKYSTADARIAFLEFQMQEMRAENKY